MADQPEIRDDIEVGGLPGGNAVAPTPGRVVPITSLAATEYVAGQPYGWYQQMPHALPWELDEIARDFGADIYERMMLDPQCRSLVNVLKASSLEQPASFRPAVERKEDDGYAIAKALTDEAEQMVDEMETSLDDTLWDLYDAVGTGNRVAEQVYELETTYSGKRQYMLRSLDVKPREAVAFVVDAYYHILGFLARIPGQPFSAQQGFLIAEPQQIPNLLPRSKFAVMTFRPHNGDPRGTSVLRPCFNSWNMKVQLQREWVKYLTQFASPSLIGFTPEGAQPRPIIIDGVIQRDPTTGLPLTAQPEQAMVDALVAFANGTATAFPYGAVVQVVEMTGEGKPFIEAYVNCNREMAKAVLNQTLATEEGENQSRGSSGTHKDILDSVVALTRRPGQRLLRNDVFTTWMLLNGRKKDLPLRPKPILGSVESEDRSRLWGAAASLHSVGYLHESQLDGMDELLGTPQRNPPGAVGISVREQIQVKEDGGASDASGDPGQPAKTVKTHQQAQGGDLAPQGSGKTGDGA